MPEITNEKVGAVLSKIGDFDYEKYDEPVEDRDLPVMGPY